MEKRYFGKMSAKEKANYIKDNLNQGMSFQEIYDATMQDNELAKSKEALLNQFKRAGYQMEPKNSAPEIIKEAPEATENILPPALKEEHDYEKLVLAADDILQMLTWWKENQSHQLVIDDRLGIHVPQEGEEVRKSFRINVQVWEAWKFFCSKHPGFTEKDLLAKALLFYMRKEN